MFAACVLGDDMVIMRPFTQKEDKCGRCAEKA